MTLIELIGFIITMAAFFLLVAKQARDERKRRQNPEAYEEEEEREHQQAVKDLLRSLNIDVPEDEPPPKAKTKPKQAPPPAPAVDQKIVEPKMIGTPIQKQKGLFRDPYALHKSFEHGDAYAKRVEQRSRIKQVLKGSNSLKQAVILKEVLGTPKGLE